ncbi:iron-containing alcohol dehydrogenase [Marinomonas agarivorans]|nr:iron-containing alcohol dehydrogenase [Marinomonas agarivorans]
MQNFSFQNRTRIHFGEKQIAKITEEIPKTANVLVVYGGGSIKKNGVYQQVSDALSDHAWFEFSGVEPNPSYYTLMQANAIIEKENINYILAVGGGSVIDGAKFIAAAACYKGRDPWNILAQKEEVSQALPIGVVLTLPATGSESNANAVVTRDSIKLAFSSPQVHPLFAILDPSVTLSLSDRQISNGVVDAFVHVLEQYLTYKVDAKVQDRFAEGLLQTLIEDGPLALTESHRNDLEVRGNLMWAATMALNGMIGVGVPQDWSTHIIGHELTGSFGIDHARTLSVVLPALIKICRQNKESKLVQYAERVWGLTEGSNIDKIDEAIRLTEAFFEEMQVPTRLSQIELGKSDIDTLINGLERNGMLAIGEHRDITLDVSRKILETAL